MEELYIKINNLEQIINGLQEEILNLHEQLGNSSELDSTSSKDYTKVNILGVVENEYLGDSPEERISTFLDIASKYSILLLI